MNTRIALAVALLWATFMSVSFFVFYTTIPGMTVLGTLGALATVNAVLAAIGGAMYLLETGLRPTPND